MTRISNPCPACGSRSLIIGHEGWLVCGNLECPSPALVDAVLSTIGEWRAERDRLERRLADFERLLAPFPVRP